MQVLDRDIASVLYCGLAVRCVCSGVWGVPDDALQVQFPDHLILAHPTCQHTGGQWHHRHLCVLPRDPGCPEGKSLHAYNCKYKQAPLQHSILTTFCVLVFYPLTKVEKQSWNTVLPWIILLF